MKQLVQDYRTGELRLEDMPSPLARRGGVLVATRASVVSAGTERQNIEFARASLLGKARDRPDLVRQVVNKARADGPLAAWSAAQSRLDDWLPLGYSSSGVVLDVGEGVAGLQVGDRVACGGQGFASHAEVAWVPDAYVAKLPPDVAHEAGAFATLGAICMHAIHKAEVAPGDRVAVIGLGLLGQLTTQILAAYGCPVIGLDVRKEAVAQALERGAVAGAMTGEDDVDAAVASFTGGRGVDAVIITAATPSNEPLATAARAARKGGRVCVVGLVGMDADRRVFYEKELRLVVAKSYGPGRDDPQVERGGFEYPLDVSRWTVRRNMDEFLRLVAAGRVTTGGLVAERVPIEASPDAYKRLVAGELHGGTLVLTYARADDARVGPARYATPPREAKAGELGLGLVGAGAFARGTLLPALLKTPGVRPVVVASAGAPHAAQTARRSGFAKATSSYADVLADGEVDLVVVATRHDLHARLAIEALEAGKHVFVEKPLALDAESLAGVLRAARASKGRLQVGFNRRFAPMVVALREHFAGRTAPLLLHYRVNAGRLPSDHWTRDAREGGGRILGEVCHFVDTLQSIVGAPIVEAYATGGAEGLDADDHLAATLRFADGSRGTIHYSGAGPESLPKERIEVVGAGRAAALENFRSLALHEGARMKRQRAFRQDKGHAAEVAAFVGAIRSGGPDAFPLADAAATTLATLALRRSLATGRPERVPPIEEAASP